MAVSITPSNSSIASLLGLSVRVHFVTIPERGQGGDAAEAAMARWGLRLLLVFVVCSALGHLSNASVLFEVLRVAGGVALLVAMGLLLAMYVTTPDPPPQSRPPEK